MASREYLYVHHVGGRGGDRRFPVLNMFEADVVSVLYDGDVDAVDGMESSAASLPSRQVVLTNCLASSPGRGVLHILNLAAGSSLLPVVPDFFQNFESIGAINFSMGAKAFATSHTLDVELTTLDDCVLKGSVPAPDFLSINTQGTEFDILVGGEKMLEGHALAIQCEVTFFPLYEGSNSLDDLCRHLYAKNYWLGLLLPHSSYVPTIATTNKIVAPPIGFRRGGICLQAEAVFFKDPRRILAGHAAPHLDLAKAVYIAVVLGNYSMAYCYSAIADLSLVPESCHYLRFARAFIAAAKQEPRVHVPDVGAFNAGSQAIANWYAQNSERAPFDQHSEQLSNPQYSKAEQVCVDFGLKEAADHLREYRIAAISDLRMRLQGRPDAAS
jgi:FkbM family methyltransferase